MLTILLQTVVQVNEIFAVIIIITINNTQKNTPQSELQGIDKEKGDSCKYCTDKRHSTCSLIIADFY